MRIIELLHKSLMKIIYPHSYSSDALITYLRECGSKIGENTYIYKSYNSIIDVNNARYISIGDNCLITEGVVILGHDYSYAVIANKYNDIVKKQRKTIIGNNVFIGVNSIILMGGVIGDNSIIGAGSVVSGKLEGNAVYAGNPAKKVCSLSDYYKKLSEDFENSAKIFAEECHDIKQMSVYLSLFDKDAFREYMSNHHFHGIMPKVISDLKVKGTILNWNDIKHK